MSGAESATLWLAVRAACAIPSKLPPPVDDVADSVGP